MQGNEIWDNLKQTVLTLSGIESMEPSKCKMLSLLIKKETTKNVSETTLKRIFGFAASPFEASLYTKNVLAQYCRQVDWGAYKLAAAEKNSPPDDQQGAWEKIGAETSKVNSFMLSAVMNNAVIPFSEMIDREFVHDHFKNFDASGALATVISAPTGYGKTIAICKWLAHKLSLQGGKDMVLYLNSSYLLSSLQTVANLNYWMLKMIGLSPAQDFQKLRSEERYDHGKFYFIIDGFDELMFRKNQFNVLSNLMLDIISIYKFSGWFKIVIVMRDSTWLNWRSQLMIDPSSWFIGKMNAEGQNVGLLTSTELNTLMHMDRPFTTEELSTDDFMKLRFPLFHLYFYKRYNAIIRYDQFSEVLFYELATDYMSQNIINGNQALNKLDFIFFLLTLTHWVSGKYKIEKSGIKLHRRGLVSTYSSLIQIGFLWETERNSAFNKRVYVHFAHQHFLSCCIAAFVLKDDPGFTPVKLEYIRQYWNKDLQLKINILKWCLFQSMSFGKLEDWIAGYQEYLSKEDLQAVNEFISLMKTYSTSYRAQEYF